MKWTSIEGVGLPGVHTIPTSTEPNYDEQQITAYAFTED